MKKSISIVLPCFNEEFVIATTVERVFAWLSRGEFSSYEVIVVNNGSTDGTGEILRQLQGRYPALTVVTHEKNEGYGGSVRSGCDHACKEVVAYMDSDGQYDIEDLGRLLPYLDRVMFVGGIRRKRSDSLLRKIYSLCWNLLIKVAFGLHAKDVGCGMKAFDRSLWFRIRPIFGTGNLFSTELYVRLKHNHIAWEQELVGHFPREHGVATGSNPRVVVEAFIQLWKLFLHKDDQPLRVSSALLPHHL